MAPERRRECARVAAIGTRAHREYGDRSDAATHAATRAGIRVRDAAARRATPRTPPRDTFPAHRDRRGGCRRGRRTRPQRERASLLAYPDDPSFIRAPPVHIFSRAEGHPRAGGGLLASA